MPGLASSIRRVFAYSSSDPSSNPDRVSKNAVKIWVSTKTVNGQNLAKKLQQKLSDKNFQ